MITPLPTLPHKGEGYEDWRGRAEHNFAIVCREADNEKYGVTHAAPAWLSFPSPLVGEGWEGGTKDAKSQMVNRVLTSPHLWYPVDDAAGGPAVHDVQDA